ncbi:hypothetical protein [Streptomyces sp. NPDC056796]
MKDDLDEIIGPERRLLKEASTLVCRSRQVLLGMPRIRRPIPDSRPERTA